MFVLYGYMSPTVTRCAIALAESGLEYRVQLLDPSKGEPKSEAYLKLHSGGRVPTLVDDSKDGVSVLHQSAAVMMYVAQRAHEEKGVLLWPTDMQQRWQAMEWLMYACTDIAGWGGMQWWAATQFPEKVPANIAFIENKWLTMLEEANRCLANQDYLAGSYSLADMALYAGVAQRREVLRQRSGFDAVLAWCDRVGAREQVQKGMALK